MELKPHNQKAVNEITSAWEDGSERIIYTSGVGTGKSFVFMGSAEDVKGKILYIIPKKSIIKNIKAYNEFSQFNDRTDFKTFQYFSNEDKGNIVRDYSLVVIDEAHHLGSYIYGKNIIKSVKDNNARVLALTATPERMDKVNVENMFQKVVRGITNFEAIEQGLMPRIEYLVCSPDAEKLAADEKAVIDWENSYELLNECIEENPKDKWICFFSNVKELKAKRPMIEKMFPEHTIMEIHSHMKGANDVLEMANNTDKCVMLNCDMLLEGLHFSGVNGIILFREVHSIPVFEQIIGRVSAIGKKENPLVIDCTDTWKRMDRYIDMDEEEENKTSNYTTLSERKGKKPCYVSLKNRKYYDYMMLLKRKWEASKRQVKPITYNGITYKSYKEALRNLNVNSKTFFDNLRRRPDEDPVVVLDYCVKNRRKAGKWDDTEKEIMLKYYPKIGLKVLEMLDGRTKDQVAAYAIRLGIKSNRSKGSWTDEEINILKMNYHHAGASGLSKTINRTRQSIKLKAKELGLKYEPA